VELPVGKDHFSKADADIEVLADRHNIHSYHTEDINTISDKQPEIILQTKENAPLVLIVEDNSDLRNYIKISLTQEYNVIEAIDGIDGIKKATSHIPDLIISDIMMPGLDGIELVNRLRNEFTTSHVPIILLTAKSTIENIIEGIKYGADAYITKPFSMELLVTRVSALIGQRKKLMERFNNQVKIVDLSPDEIVVTAKDEQFLKEVLKIIEENMSDADFHIEKIASTIGLGRTTFFKKLKSLTGFAPVEFMREMRLKRGFQLLESAEYTVSEVAYMLGFSDAGYFTKCFKEKYNITPTEVIKKSKKQ
jgi:DNA-binding response OmpR family regulator